MDKHVGREQRKQKRLTPIFLFGPKPSSTPRTERLLLTLSGSQKEHGLASASIHRIPGGLLDEPQVLMRRQLPCLDSAGWQCLHSSLWTASKMTLLRQCSWMLMRQCSQEHPSSHALFISVKSDCAQPPDPMPPTASD